MYAHTNPRTYYTHEYTLIHTYIPTELSPKEQTCLLQLPFLWEGIHSVRVVAQSAPTRDDELHIHMYAQAKNLFEVCMYVCVYVCMYVFACDGMDELHMDMLARSEGLLEVRVFLYGYAHVHAYIHANVQLL